MAIGFNILDAGTFATTGTPSTYATAASFTPTANALVLLAIVNSHASVVTAVVGVSGNGLTWVAIDTEPYNLIAAPIQRVTWYRSMGASPTNGQVTADFGTGQTGCGLFACEFTGVDTSGTNGSGAIVQSSKARADIISLVPTAFNMDSALDASGNNAIIACFGGDQNPFAGTAETNWTEDVDSGYNTPTTGMYVTHRLATTDNSIAVTSGDGSWGAIGLEIKSDIVGQPTVKRFGGVPFMNVLPLGVW